ncbi:kinetochore scaffold 1 [Xenopus laevis]|uniref:Kinetochore scaffold 1 n=1 Tax=Xenopus laevis TaxID=8355 RepID=A0A8J1LL48_XENLA|nr:kinetochore scaffold 1 [Xenopus laevis]
MDGNPLPQDDSDVTERSHRRRLSSILKVPRSPLRDLGNVLHQDSTTEKRRKSRRVSFAENIRVFSLESQIAADDNGQVTVSGNENEDGMKSRFQITGMDTLLHGPIQTPAPQPERDCADNEKTLFFSCDNDMEMTSSNTINIDAFLEEKTDKIDVTSFLASLKSHGEDSCESVKLNPSTTIDFHSSSESEVQPKINFKDFLTGLKTEKQTICPFQGNDKENFFSFSISNEKSTPGSDVFSTFAQRQEEKENITQVFTEQDDGLDMTKCHTTNITAFVPVTDAFPYHFEPNTISFPKAPSSHEHLQGGLQLQKLKTVSKNQTVLLEDDMDITQNRSVCLDNVLSKTRSGGNTQALNKGMGVCPADKTVFFTDSNEMEFTQNHTVAINTNTGAGDPLLHKKNLLNAENNFVSPDNSMDLTKSHTVAIDGRSMVASCASTSTSLPDALGNRNNVGDPIYFSKSILRQNQDPSLPFHLTAEKTIAFDDEDMDLNTSNTAHIMFGLGSNISMHRKSIPVMPTSHLFIMNDKTVVSNQDMDLTQCTTTVLDTDSCYGLQSSNETCSEQKVVRKSGFLPKPTFSSEQSSPFEEDKPFNNTVSSSKSMPSTVADKTLLFSCNQDDMEITKSHTVAIDKFLQDPDLAKIPENVSKGKTVKPGGLRLSSFSKHVLFPKASNDVELIKGNTVNEKPWQKAKESCQPSSDHQEKAPTFNKSCADTKISETRAVENMTMRGLTTNFKNIVGTFPSSHNKTILSLENMDLTVTTKNAFRDEGTFPTEEVKTGITAQDKTILFSCEEENMDMTRSHTVTIDRKDLCKGSKNAINMLSTKNVSTFSSELDFIESHTLTRENKVSVVDEYLKLASNVKSTSKSIPDRVHTISDKRSENRTVRLSEEKNMFSPSEDYMDFTQSCTVAIENNLCEELKTAKTTSQKFDLSKSVALDETVEDNMELTKSHTMVISAKCPDEHHHQSFATKTNTEAGFGEDDMDITKSNTIFINEIPEISKGLVKSSALRRKSAPEPKRSCFANDKTIHLEGDMEMTTANIGPLINDANILRVKNVGLDKTVVFSREQDNMDLTLSHTVAIESKGLCELNLDAKNKPGHYSKQTPLPLNKTVHMVEDDMELTRSHTMVINEQPAELHLQSDPVNKSNSDDMDITKSNTVFIKETEIFKGQVDLSILKKTSASGSRRSYVSDKTVRLEGDMEMTAANVGQVINGAPYPVQRKSIGLSHDKTLVFSSEQEHMDLTMSHTIAIESKGICEVAKALNPNVNCSVLSVPVNKSTVILEDDMDLTKSHTMVISKNDPSNSAHKRNYSTDFGQDDMEITRSDTIFIDDMPVAERSKGQLNCLLKRESVCLKGSDFSVHLDGDMELTRAGTGLLVSDTNVPSTETTLGSCNNKTMLFSCEQDNMDLTVANTVAIESKGLCEGSETRNLGVKRILGSSSKHSSVPENKAFTMFAEEMEMTKSHTMVIEQKTPLLDEYNHSVDKQSLVSETSEADGMDITKSNTVFIDSHLDGLCKTSLGSKKQNLPLAQQSCSTNEPLHGDTVAKMRGKNGRSSNVFQGYDQGNTDIDMSHTDVTKQSALNKEIGNSDRFQNYIDHHSAPACKTIVFSTLEDDMDLTKSHTMVIDGRNILKGENVSSRQPGQITANSDKSVAFSSGDMDFTLSPSARLEKGIFELAQHEEMINILSKAKKGNILELQRPFLNKHATVNFSMHEGDVEFTKSHTVAIELDNQTPSSVLNKQGMEPETNMGKRMKSLVKGGRIVSDANMDVGNIHTSKTLCNLNDMDMTRSLTVAIENKTEELQIMVATDPKNWMAENPENLRIPLSTSNPNVFVPDLGEKNLNEMVFCEDADKASPMDQQETKVVEIALSDTKNFSSVASLEPAEHINRSEEPVLADEACMLHKDTTDLKTTKKARPKSKRVSFMLPEPEAGSCVPKANVLEASTKPTTEINMDVCNLKQNSSMAILGNSADKEGETVKSMADYYDANDGLAQGSLVHCKPKEQNISPGNVGNLEQEDQDTLSCKGPVLKSSNLVEFSEADKMRRRRSIADIQSKIRSLNKKSFPDSQTAPVTFLVDHLSTSLQAPTVSLTNKSEDILEDAELSSKLPIHEKPNLYTQADDVASSGDKETTSKETNLPNKLSVKVFQAKLPQKTNPNKCNVQESSSFYEAHVKPERNSLTLLKALTNCNSSQCIDEEILPLSPDEKDHDGIFHYEVPEGAWEELCEKEALHCSLEQDIPASQDGINDKKRNREPEETNEFQKEKRGRTEGKLNSDKSKASVTIASPDDYQISEFSSLHLTKTIEQTNYSSNSSQDSRGDGMHMELSCSQQCSQMESQLPWDTGCEQSLWVKFQDGTITVKEFFMLLRIRILIQKPRYSELPANYRANKAAMTEDLLLDQYIYQPKLQVYEEECHALGQIIQELKTFAETQEKPLMQVNSLLWEAMRMCSEDEVIYFGVKLKSLKSLYSKKSKVLAHERKVTVYSKLLHVAQTRCEQLQSRINEVDTFLEETDKCISELQSEIDKLDEDIQSGNLINMDPTVKGLQTELEKLQTEEVNRLRECAQLEDRKDQVLTQLGCLQEQANKMEKQLEEFNFTEWDLDKWTEDQAIFTFLYDSIELCIQFGDVVDGMPFVSKPCRRLSMVTFDSQLNEEAAPPSSLLAHRLIMQFIERNGCFYEKYKTQQDLPQMLFDLSLAMSRCRLLGEEVDYLMKWGAKYNILKIQVQSTEVKLLFSSSLAYAKFELVVHLSESYPTLPLTFTFRNHIGKIGHSNISAVLSEVPVGMWYLKRAVRRIHRQLLA